MKAETQKIMNAMVDFANEGNEIIPMYWQPGPFGGINACVGAAVRAAKKRGLLVEGGLDGVGKPFYVAPAKPLPIATHVAPETVQ